LENRFEPLTLPLWQDDAEFASLLASFASTLPLRQPSKLDVPDLIRLLSTKAKARSVRLQLFWCRLQFLQLNLEMKQSIERF
jgi:hypothetical protein